MSLLLLFQQQAAAPAGDLPTVQVFLEGVGDVSADYRLVSTVRGRNRELDEFQAGTAQVTFVDTARRFDPSNTASAYYPHVRPMSGVQVAATWNGTTYPVFTGTIDSVESTYAGPPNGYAETTLYLTDGFKNLEAADLATSAYAQEVLADSPAHWYRLGEPQGTATFFDTAGTRDLTVDGGAPDAVDGLVARDDNGAQQTPDNAVGGTSDLTLTGGVIAFTAEIVFEQPTQTIGTLVGEANQTGTAIWSLTLQEVAATWKMQFAMLTTAGVVTVTGATELYNTGAHHIAATWDGITMRLYVDGALDGSAAQGGTLFTSSDASYIVFAGGTIGPFNTFGVIDGIYDELAIYRTVLSADRIAAHAAQVATPWDGDSPGERIGRVLDAVDWDGGRDLDDGSVTLLPAELDTTALEHAQKVARSDFGAFFITADGTARFIGREGLFNRPQLYTFGDGGGAELGYVSLRPELTDQLIANDVTVSRLEGTAQRVQDATSIATYLRHSLTLDGLLFDDDEFALHAAQFLVSERKQPVRRVSNLTVAPRGAPTTLFPAVLGLELEDQVTIVDRPPGGGAANTQDTSVEGISHTITPMGWETAWNLAPSLGAMGTPPNVWQLGVAGFSELGQTTRLAF